MDPGERSVVIQLPHDAVIMEAAATLVALIRASRAHECGTMPVDDAMRQYAIIHAGMDVFVDWEGRIRRSLERQGVVMHHHLP